MSETITLLVKPFRLSWQGRTFKRGDIVRYHSHFGEWRSDFHSATEPHIIDQHKLDMISSNGWFTQVVYRDYWSTGTLEEKGA